MESLMLYTCTAVAIFAGALAATSVWQIQNWRYEGKIAEIHAEQAEALASAESSARAREQTLNAKNRKITDAYQTEKKRRTDDALASDAALRVFQSALATPSAVAPNPSPGGGIDDPRAAILSECSGALVKMDDYAKRLASQTRGLQSYVEDVCLSTDK